MDQHDVEFQRFLQKLEFSDTEWMRLVEQKIKQQSDHCPRSPSRAPDISSGIEPDLGAPKNSR